MKNALKNNEIRWEDFRSLFLWKVFWKLLKRRTFLSFCLKSLFLVIGFILFSPFISRFDGFAKKEGKIKAANKSPANKRQTTQKVQTKTNKK
jgi:hypothetical protein